MLKFKNYFKFNAFNQEIISQSVIRPDEKNFQQRPSE